MDGTDAKMKEWWNNYEMLTDILTDTSWNPEMHKLVPILHHAYLSAAFSGFVIHDGITEITQNSEILLF